MNAMHDVLDAGNIRNAYEQAVAWYLARVGGVDEAHWHDTGLDDWTVRELAAHGARSITLVTTYLDAAAAPASDDPTGGDAVPPLLPPGPFAYWQALFGTYTAEQLADLARQVAERGKQGVVALGDDAVRAVWTMAESTLNRLAVTPDDAPMTTPFGRLTLVGYLPSRVVELVVHGLDLCRSTGQPLSAPDLPTQVTMAMLTGFGDPARVILALTGREPYAVIG
jgi:Mycothiol maleylpyruvate isomerase N-terminal domain